MKNTSPFRLAGIGLTCLALAFAGSAHARAPSSNEPVRLPIMQSSDFDFIVTVYGEVLKEAGYRVEYVESGYTVAFSGLKAGDLDATVAWDTSPDLIDDAIESGKGINAGSAGVAISEGWWFPAYVKESCPGLPSWEALKDPACMDALSTAETAPMGRYVDAPPDWSTRVVERIEAFGLEMEAVSTGSPVTLMATMQGAIQRGEPVMGWGYHPHWLMSSVEGQFVEFPTYEPACIEDPSWGMTDKTYDCGYSRGWVWKLLSKAFSEREPYATRVLYLMNIDESVVGKGMNQVDNEGMSLHDAAHAWMDENPQVWKLWIE